MAGDSKGMPRHRVWLHQGPDTCVGFTNSGTRLCSHGEAQKKVLWWPGTGGAGPAPGGMLSPSVSEATSAPADLTSGSSQL